MDGQLLRPRRLRLPHGPPPLGVRFECVCGGKAGVHEETQRLTKSRERGWLCVFFPTPPPPPHTHTNSVTPRLEQYRCWNGDRRLREKYGEDVFAAFEEQTSVLPFKAILEVGLGLGGGVCSAFTTTTTTTFTSSSSSSSSSSSNPRHDRAGSSSRRTTGRSLRGCRTWSSASAPWAPTSCTPSCRRAAGSCGARIGSIRSHSVDSRWHWVCGARVVVEGWQPRGGDAAAGFAI